ncbi:hypothetical protein ACFO5U_04755 [Planococcus dechangensis]|uniref:Uncharacterized protein n=1 Tax=Planococcus dechangensis TaxID=1176255 RepID=A0ABV9MAX0_9BACL
MQVRPVEILQAFKEYKLIHFSAGQVVRKEGELHNRLSHVIQVAISKPYEQKNTHRHIGDGCFYYSSPYECPQLSLNTHHS